MNTIYSQKIIELRQEKIKENILSTHFIVIEYTHILLVLKFHFNTFSVCHVNFPVLSRLRINNQFSRNDR